MEYFEQGKEILSVRIGQHVWTFRVLSVYNPSPEEIERNRKHNDSLGNFEPDKELPESPFVHVSAECEDGETIAMWFDPTYRNLGPHVSREGWSRGLFMRLKGILCSWRLPAPPL